MRSATLTLVTLALIFGASPAAAPQEAESMVSGEQTLSGPIRQTPRHVDALARVGRVWGFLKYHHSGVTSGARDWDTALLRALPGILEDPDSAGPAMGEWAAGLGEQPECGPCPALPADLHFPPDLAWMQDRGLGEELRAWLARVHERRDAQGWQWYVSSGPVGNPDFSREDGHVFVTSPDTAQRLLVLFRYWNIIQYWFPYRDLIQDQWDGVLREFIPKFAGAEGPDSFQLTVLELIARVKDTHAFLGTPGLLRPPVGPCRLPVHLRFVEGRAVVTAWAHPQAGPAGGLEIGDVILSLDGSPVSTLLMEWSPYYSASNEAALRRDVARRMTRGECGPVEVLGLRSRGAFRLAAERVPAAGLDDTPAFSHELPGDEFQLLTEEVAYLKISGARRSRARNYIFWAEGTRGLILDARSYPSDFLLPDLANHLVAEPKRFAEITVGDLTNPGAFRWRPTFIVFPVFPVYEGKVVILVDELTQSSAEFHAMAFRAAPGALVVGSTTAGADGNVSEIPLMGGMRTLISGIGIFYGDRTPTQQVGIVPDVFVHPTIEGIRAGRDEVLEEAIRLILADAPAD